VLRLGPDVFGDQQLYRKSEPAFGYGSRGNLRQGIAANGRDRNQDGTLRSGCPSVASLRKNKHGNSHFKTNTESLLHILAESLQSLAQAEQTSKQMPKAGFEGDTQGNARLMEAVNTHSALYALYAQAMRQAAEGKETLERMVAILYQEDQEDTKAGVERLLLDALPPSYRLDTAVLVSLYERDLIPGPGPGPTSGAAGAGAPTGQADAAERCCAGIDCTIL